MNNKILSIHPTLGVITFSDLINNLELMLKNIEMFEHIVNEILHHTEMSEEDISTIFNYSIIESLKWNIDILKQLL